MVWERQPVLLRNERVRTWRALLAEAGHDVDEVTVKVAVSAAWKWLIASMAEGRPVLAVDAARRSVAQLRLPTVAPALEAELLDAFLTATRRVELPVADGLADAIAGLKAAGVRVGIICDVGIDPSPELRGVLDRAGLLGSFDHWTFSDEVGSSKPNAAMFDHAAAGLGVASGRHVAHIGDSHRADIAGALAAGWTAVRYVGAVDDPPEPEGEAHHVIAHHDELLAVLGVG